MAFQLHASANLSSLSSSIGPEAAQVYGRFCFGRSRAHIFAETFIEDIVCTDMKNDVILASVIVEVKTEAESLNLGTA